MVQYAEDDKNVRDEYNKGYDNINVFNQLFTTELNRFVDKLMVDGSVQITPTGETFTKREGKTRESTRYLNNGLLMGPVLAYLNANVPVLGLGTQYAETRKITTRDGSIAVEFVLGVIKTAVSGLSPAAVGELVQVMGNANNELTASVSNEDDTKVYNTIVPLFFFDDIGRRIRCAFTIIRCILKKEVLRVAIGCVSYNETTVDLEIAVEKYNVNLGALNDIVADDKETIEMGRNFLKRNRAARKAGTMDDANATVMKEKTGAFQLI